MKINLLLEEVIAFFRNGHKKEKSSLDARFHWLFMKEYYYLSNQASLTVFSDMINLTPYELESYVLTKYGISFENLCAYCRIRNYMDKFDHLISNQMTLGALVKSAGFSSQEDFKEAVKIYNNFKGSKLLPK